MLEMCRRSPLKPSTVADNASNINISFQMAFHQDAWGEKADFAWDTSNEHDKWSHREPRTNLKSTDSKYDNNCLV